MPFARYFCIFINVGLGEAAKRDVCNFAIFSGLIDAQFWAKSVKRKSPELIANCS